MFRSIQLWHLQNPEGGEIWIRAQEGYIHISPFAWNTWDSSAGLEMWGGGAGTSSYVLKTTASEYLYVPVYFPPEADGLLVKHITISYYDAGAGDLRYYLRKVDLYDQGVTTVANIISTGNIAGWRKMYINRWDMSARRIDNERYAWYIAIYFSVENSSDLRLGNIKIKYATE